jgi:hypothetical protein
MRLRRSPSFQIRSMGSLFVAVSLTATEILLSLLYFPIFYVRGDKHSARCCTSALNMSIRLDIGAF